MKDSSSAWSVADPAMLPYIWLGLRHASLALLNDTAQTEGKEPTPEQLQSTEDAYSGCKVSALLAVLDAVLDHDDIITGGCSDEEVTEAAAAAISQASCCPPMVSSSRTCPTAPGPCPRSPPSVGAECCIRWRESS